MALRAGVRCAGARLHERGHEVAEQAHFRLIDRPFHPRRDRLQRGGAHAHVPVRQPRRARALQRRKVRPQLVACAAAAA